MSNLPGPVPTQTRGRTALLRAALIIPFVIVLACIMGPVIYAVALTARRANPQPPPTFSTTPPSTYTFPSTTAGNATTTHTTSTTTSSTSTSTVTSTAATTTSTSSTHPSTAPTAPATTRTTTTTHTTTTSAAFATCQACSLNAVLGSCASEYAACQANTYNCPVLCYGTFQQNGNPPATCTNGFIPQWPPLRECICHTANITCQSECSACAYTTATSRPETTSPEAACESCYTTATRGPCSSQAAACNANPVGSCALVCAPYYKANLYIFEGCANVSYWPALASCLCPYCGNNVTCTENQC